MDDNIDDAAERDSSPSNFMPLGLAEVEGFPQLILAELAEQWSKSPAEADKARARAVLGKLPRIGGGCVSKATLKIAIRCCSDQAAVEWVRLAREELREKLSKGYARWKESAPMGTANFMAEAALAIRRSKRAVDLAGESLRRGAFDVFRALRARNRALPVERLVARGGRKRPEDLGQARCRREGLGALQAAV